jgi:hypothetical protein
MIRQLGRVRYMTVYLLLLFSFGFIFLLILDKISLAASALEFQRDAAATSRIMGQRFNEYVTS